MVEPRRVFLTGSGGFLGNHLAKALAGFANLELITKSNLGLARLDLETPGRITALIRQINPDLVIHAAAMTSLAECDLDPNLARRINVDASVEIAQALADLGGRLVFISTDQVFAGDDPPTGGYAEGDSKAPRHLYGETKSDAEDQISSILEDSLSCRLALIYGESPSGKRSASEMITTALRSGTPCRLFHDEFRCPLEANFAAQAIAQLGLSTERGLIHIAGPQRLSRFEFGRLVAAAYDLRAENLVAISLSDSKSFAQRPKDLNFSTLSLNRLGFVHPCMQESLEKLARGRD